MGGDVVSYPVTRQEKALQNRTRQHGVRANRSKDVSNVAAAFERLEARTLLSTTDEGGDLVMLRPPIVHFDDTAAPFPLTGAAAAAAAAAVTAPGFQIELVFPDDSLSSEEKALFAAAAARWQTILLGDISNVTGDFTGDGVPETVDDVLISATVTPIDGPGHILGSAGPEFVRSSNSLPIAGSMKFDSADVATMEADGGFQNTILHEMGHVLGFGSIWGPQDRNLLSGAGTDDPRFNGLRAGAQYQSIFGTKATTFTVPVENTGGDGTADSHWREGGGAGAAFGNELMTGFTHLGEVNPISRITIAQFIDIGYPSVNLNAFDVFVPPDGGNAYPTIASLTAGPNPGVADAPVTLTANNAADPDSGVKSVRFYRETNNVPGLQVLGPFIGDVPGDVLVATDNDGSDGFSVVAPTTGLAAGTYGYYAQATDLGGLVSLNVATTHTIGTVTQTPPSLLSTTVNDGSAQRSQVRSLKLTFDRPVSLAAGALKLVRLNTGNSGLNDNSAPTDASAVLGVPTTADGGLSWTVAFVAGNPFMQTTNGQVTGPPTGSLVDGIYTLGVDPTKVANAAPDHTPMATTPAAFTFHRLFGDQDGNRTANNGDYGRFRSAFLKSTGQAGFDAAFDFDGNGVVNNLDYGQFRSRFLKVYSY